MNILLPLLFCAASSVAAVVAVVFWRRAERDARAAESALAGEKARAKALGEQLETIKAAQEDFKTYAKAAAFETGQQLSSKLLEDHKRERESANKQIEQFTKTATEQMTARQAELAKTVNQMQGQMGDTAKTMNILVRAMQNPMGAGIEGEISMNNLLQQHGYTEGTDYELQVHLAEEGGSLKPDCVLYMPQQHAVIIDSKASQHIISLFETEGTDAFGDAFKELQTTMRQHAKALAGKAYQDAVKKLKNHHGQPITRTTLVMFVPNDEVVSRLMQKDPNLMTFMREHNIVLAGKVTLSGLLLAMRALKLEARQQEESHAIMELCRALMGDMLMATKHATKVINGIRGSAKSFDEFSGSMNRALNRMRKINAKGLTPTKNEAIPANLPRYDISKTDDVIQLEVEEAPEQKALPQDAA